MLHILRKCLGIEEKLFSLCINMKKDLFESFGIFEKQEIRTVFLSQVS